MPPASEPVQRWEDDAREASRRAGEQGIPGGHPEIDRKVLALTRMAVAHIDENPKLLAIGLENIERWTRLKGYLPLCHAEWKELIETHPWERLREILLEESDEGQRLRSSHPFVGIVTPEERATIYGPVPAPSPEQRMRNRSSRRQRWPDNPIVAHEANRHGRDLVIGDLHGHFDTLEHALDELAFDPDRDRLFSVGDLIDRGPRSEAALDWLSMGRIAAVRGNHEQMMIDTLDTAKGRLTKSPPARAWLDNGGGWWWGWSGEDDRDRDLDAEQANQARREQWLHALREVPYARTIETAQGSVGIVHTTASYHQRWEQIVRTIEDLAVQNREMQARFDGGWGHPPDGILWSRPEIERGRRDADDLPQAIAGIDLVLIGHTPGPAPRWTRANVLCIDTGVHVADYGHLTVAEIQTGTAKLHRVGRVTPAST